MYTIDNSTQANRVRHRAYNSLMDLLKIGDKAVCNVTREIRIENCGQVAVFEVGDTVVIGEYTGEINDFSIRIEEYNKYMESNIIGLQGYSYSGTYRDIENLTNSLSIDEEKTIKIGDILHKLKLDERNADHMKFEADLNNPDVTAREVVLIVVSILQFIALIATVPFHIGWVIRAIVFVIAVTAIILEWVVIYKLDSNRKKMRSLIQDRIDNQHRVNVGNIKRNGSLPLNYGVDFKELYNSSYLRSQKIVKRLASGDISMLQFSADNSQIETNRALDTSSENRFSENLD